MVTLNQVEIDFITTPVYTESGVFNADVLVWPEPRYLIGWGPWIGVDKNNCFEGHLALDHIPQDASQKTVPVFMRGLHKEGPGLLYDEAICCDFFPSGCGRFVAAGDQLLLQLAATNTGDATDGNFGIQGSARIFSVKAGT